MKVDSFGNLPQVSYLTPECTVANIHECAETILNAMTNSPIAITCTTGLDRAQLNNVAKFDLITTNFVSRNAWLPDEVPMVVVLSWPFEEERRNILSADIAD